MKQSYLIKHILPILLSVSISGYCQHVINPHYEKIIFHSGGCYGSCPIYHLEIGGDRMVKLFVQEAFKKDDKHHILKDTSKMGRFIGKISDSIFTDLTNELNKIGIDKLEFGENKCCDLSMITMIVYYNGKRKYLQSMFPPEITSTLILKLYRICETHQLKKTTENFIIEYDEIPIVT